MRSVDSTTLSNSASRFDFDRFRLRRLVEELVGRGEVEVRDSPTDLADVADILHGNPKAVWFRQLGPERTELVGNVVASRARIAHAFGVSPKDLTAELVRRLKTAQDVIEVSRADAPVQHTILTGRDLDLTALPAHLQHGADGSLYISAGIDYTNDVKTGWTNVGFRRLMLRGRLEMGIDLAAPGDLRTIYDAARSRGEALPVSFVVGSHPADMVAATMRVPCDEIELVAQMRNAPLPVVKCVTNDIRVPADAEWVIEGYLDARGHVEAEGPYGEFVGYYGGLKRNPVFHVTAITRRSDALFQTVTISGRQMGKTDTALLETVRNEVTVWHALESVVREPIAVYVPVSTGGMLNARVAMRQRSPGEVRSAIHTVLGSTLAKHVFVVDPDIDIFSDEMMEWALATRFQGDRDLVVIEHVRSMPLDPSLRGQHIGTKVGFDLTWPFGTGNRLEESVPEPPRYGGRRFSSLRAALDDGAKSFEELMAAIGTRDGRDVVRELEALQKEPGLERDAMGRYMLKGASNDAANEAKPAHGAH
jgi:UbiD family decarboxylase